jgi:glucose/mannose-6-phosphate isomerase
MISLIQRFPEHIQKAIELFNGQSIQPKKGISNVVITGLGGSGIGGTIAAELSVEISKVPIHVNKGYSLPAFVKENTLLIACSYSGNTEETLMALGIGREKGAQIACITSGGKLEQISKDNGYDHVVIPGGNPPRSMLAYSLSILLLFLESYGIAGDGVQSKLNAAATMLEKEQESMMLQANELAKKTKDMFPVTYACSGFSGVATRWRQQFNENAKLPGWDAEIPEMNHNELVGWAGGNNDLAVYFLRSTDDFWRNQKRVEISVETVSKMTSSVYEIWTQGQSKIEQVFYLIHLGDWISYYLSEERKVDILDIQVIDHLKSELSNL